MFTWLGRMLMRLPLAVRVVLALVAAALPGMVGYFVADRLWDSGIVGAIAPYLLAWFVSDERTATLAISAVIAFVTSVPLIYVLILVVQGLLFALDLTSYPSVGDFLLRNLDGVAKASAITSAATMLGALKRLADPSGSGAREDPVDVFLVGLSFRFPLAVFIAGLFDLPEAPGARVVLGVAFGVVAAASVTVHSVVVDEEPIKHGWVSVLLMELLLLAGAVFSLLDGLDGNRKELDLAWQLFPAAAIACAATFLLTWLAAAVVGRIRDRAASGIEQGA